MLHLQCAPNTVCSTSNVLLILCFTSNMHLILCDPAPICTWCALAPMYCDFSTTTSTDPTLRDLSLDRCPTNLPSQIQYPTPRHSQTIIYLLCYWISVYLSNNCSREWTCSPSRHCGENWLAVYLPLQVPEEIFHQEHYWLLRPYLSLIIDQDCWSDKTGTVQTDFKWIHKTICFKMFERFFSEIVFLASEADCNPTQDLLIKFNQAPF